MNRPLNTLVASLALAAGTLAPAIASAHGDRMLNGHSVYGSVVTETPAAKVVDVTAARSLNVACGDVVTFKNGAQSFTWKFEAAGHRAVDLQAIAPAGFSSKPLAIYVSRNESERT